MATFRRRQKLPKRKLQLKLTLIFVGMVALGLMLQFLLFMRELTMVGERLPNDGAVLMDEASGMLATAFLASCAVLLPITFVIGVLTTFRIAGPIYRFEKFLGSIAKGEDPGECTLRKGDELLELCDALNKAVKRLREDKQFKGYGAATENSAGEDGEPTAALPEEEDWPAPRS
jgi:methyl-accepting chemotaxis protein